MLAADIRLAADDTRFGQIEINRGIFPFGGATLRFPQIAGWGNAMRWLLTGDKFDATEARRLGLVQEITAPDALESRALSLAQTIASRAPLGVQATLTSARSAIENSFETGATALQGQIEALMATEDAAEGVRSFVDRREAKFKGR
jgi:enoyl-CoA hydratase/carnithine racemase